MYCGAPARWDGAADQGHRLERQVVVDLDAGQLGHDGPLRERAQPERLPEVPVAVEPEGAVKQRSPGLQFP